MGLCASSPIGKGSENQKTGSRNTKQHYYYSSSSSSSSTTIMVIHGDGKLQVLKQATKARKIRSQNPNYFLCSSESMSIGTCVPHMQDDEDLQMGQIYFLLPLSQSRKPLLLPDLCALAVKANSALGQHKLRQQS
ncbi:uncharacterized protein LOC125370589 [Ricinus communis]|uniref:DUF4228 domain-containing protein n=1 Tax=Ricinus communis TaxID=3988 RepID=B9S8S1_RICCO|nr:uncharacterized protein LOC125370589 [Ricinus communis]EEF40074.1 conserved hypothetical protein [Ricinus communis]